MNNKTLIASFALVAGLASVSSIVQADEPHKTVQPSSTNTRELVENDRAPDIYMRSDKAINWKAKGLKAPGKEEQWVENNGKYMRVKTTNGTIVEITPVKK